MFDTEIDRLNRLLSIRICRAQRELQDIYPSMQFRIAEQVKLESAIRKDVCGCIVATSPEVPGHFLELRLQKNVRRALSDLYTAKISSGPTIVRKHVESAFDNFLFDRDIELTTDNMLNGGDRRDQMQNGYKRNF